MPLAIAAFFNTLVYFAIVLGALIVVHEFGHFITAKWAGIRVEEFGIGFPPRLIGFRKRDSGGW